MPVPNSMADLATLASSNFPTGTESIGNSLDNYIRALSAIIRSTNAISSATIASASTTDISSSDGQNVTVTGAATINSLGTGFAGCLREVYFSGSLTIINSASIILPRAVNLAVAAGDTCTFRCVSAGVWRFVSGRLSNPNYANVYATSVSDATGDLRTGSGGLNDRLPLTGAVMQGAIGMRGGQSYYSLLWRSADATVSRIGTYSDEFTLFFNSFNDSGGLNGTILRLSRTSLDVQVGGNLTAVGNITSNSDERLKENWAEIRSDVVDRLAGVRAGDYDRIDTGARQTGVSAQSIEEVFPHLVSEDEGVKSVAYGNAALVGVVALSRRIVELERRSPCALAARAWNRLSSLWSQ